MDTSKNADGYVERPAVDLVGEDGNAFAIIRRCVKAAQQARWPQERIDEFRAKAMSGNYNNLLVTCMDYFDVQ